MESRFVGLIVLFFLRAVAWLFYFLPPGGKNALSVAIGWLLRMLRVRKQVVEQNLLIAFPGPSLEESRRREILLKESYRHLGWLGLEILMLLGPLGRYVRSHCVIHGLERWEEAKKRGKGVVFLSSHVGNWEVMGAAGAYWGGVDAMIVTKHLKPEWLHQAIENGRRKCGVLATYEPRTMRDILSHLKKNGTIGFVLDQYAGPPVGVRVPFFGVHVSTSTALAALAKRTGAVILPVVNHRDADGRFVVDVRPPLEWIEPATTEGESKEEVAHQLAVNTAAYVSVMEQDIRRFPGQWLWIHRRFKGDLSPLREGEWHDGRARK